MARPLPDGVVVKKGERYCAKCQQVKSLEFDYYTDKRYRCSQCEREDAREAYKLKIKK